MNAAIPPLSSVTVEGAVARVVGRQVEDNPFDSVNAPMQHKVWKWAWRYCDALLEHVIEHELADWLEDEAA